MNKVTPITKPKAIDAKFAFDELGGLVVVKQIGNKYRTIRLTPEEEQEMYEKQTARRQPWGGAS